MQQNVLQRVPFWKIVVGWLFWIVVIGVLVFALVKWGVPAISRGAQSLFAQANQSNPVVAAGATQIAVGETKLAQLATSSTAQAQQLAPTQTYIAAESTKLAQAQASSTAMAQQSTPTAAPTLVPPTVAPQQVSNPTASAMAASSSISPTVSLTSTIGCGCTKHGTVAWQNDNQLSGAPYGEAPVGGLSEPCGIVGQTWTTIGGVTERFVFYVPSYAVAWLSGHRGGTGWYWDPCMGDPSLDLQKQADELEKRDGIMKTTLAVLPGQSFRLVTRFMSAALPSPTTMLAVSVTTPTPTPTTSVAPKPTVAVTATVAIQAASGKCNIGGESVGPAILEGEVNGKTTVIKLNAGSKFVLAAGGCFPFLSQAALDARWPDHKAEFLKKYPAGQAIEK